MSRLASGDGPAWVSQAGVCVYMCVLTPILLGLILRTSNLFHHHLVSPPQTPQLPLYPATPPLPTAPPPHPSLLAASWWDAPSGTRPTSTRSSSCRTPWTRASRRWRRGSCGSAWSTARRSSTSRHTPWLRRGGGAHPWGGVGGQRSWISGHARLHRLGHLDKASSSYKAMYLSDQLLAAPQPVPPHLIWCYVPTIEIRMRNRAG